MTTCSNLFKIIALFMLFTIGLVFLVQSVAVVIDFDETLNYINNTCAGLGNFTIHRHNAINERATTVTTSLDSDLNITLYYPPVDVWVFWSDSDAHEWYNQLKALADKNITFPCFINYPETRGISAHLTGIWLYYILGAAMFILCGGCIIYCCFIRTHRHHNSYYRLS